MQSLEVNPFQVLNNRLDSLEKKIESLSTNAPSEKGEKDLLTRLETADLLQINLATLWRWTKKEKLKSYGIGNRVYYKRSEIMDSIQSINSAN